MQIEPLDIQDVLAITPRRFGDARGYFSETYNKRTLKENGFEQTFVQDNQSLSRDSGTIRGLHFQLPPSEQGKLVRVVRGSILDVAVDIRRGSPTFGRHVSLELSAENGIQLWVPAGFAHGFCTLEPDTEVLYKVTDYYAPDCDSGIDFADPDLAIEWPVDATAAVVSDKDARLPRLAEFDNPFVYEE